MKTTKLRHITSEEFKKRFHYFLQQAKLCPLVIDEKTVLMSHDFYIDLERPFE